MQSELISLADYLHAFAVVLGRLPQAATDSPAGQRQAAARSLVHRLEAGRGSLGIGAVEQAEFARLSGQCLPDRVIVWLNDCGRRLFAREFDAVAEDILTLCRALEKLLYRPARCALPICRTAHATAKSYRRSPLLPRREAAGLAGRGATVAGPAWRRRVLASARRHGRMAAADMTGGEPTRPPGQAVDQAWPGPAR